MVKRKIIVILVIFGIILVGTAAVAKINTETYKIKTNQDGTEYWALLVGCNEFRYRPDAYLPGNDEAAKDFRNLLLTSDNWQEDNIKVITGKDATKRNIINGLKWLDQMDDEDDICLFSISTHGAYNDDIFKKDEDDGLDEFLMVYDSYHNLPILGLCSFWFDFLYDDHINYYLSKLESKGICAIIGSCYSGGFDDKPLNRPLYKNHKTSDDKLMSSSTWMDEFGEDLAQSGRIVLMACAENQISRGNIFEYLLIDGLKGLAGSENGWCSVEDSYVYTVPILKENLLREFGYNQKPKIFDDYSGDLFITKEELPPAKPTFSGPELGQKDVEQSFTITSIDQENDRIKYYIDWGDGAAGWTDLYNSNEPITITHTWSNTGTYNVFFKCQDEHNVGLYDIVTMDHRVISIIDEETIGQKMTITYEGQCFNDIFMSDPFYYYAQSFKPTTSKLTRIDLSACISIPQSQKIWPIKVSVRDDLQGDDLTEITVMPYQLETSYHPTYQWTTADIPDIEVVPGNTYYIIIRYIDSGSFGIWMYSGLNYNFDPNYVDDPYTDGKPFFSNNRGLSWDEITAIQDFCFVTYG